MIIAAPSLSAPVNARGAIGAWRGMGGLGTHDMVQGVSAPQLAVRNVSRSFGNFVANRDVSIDVGAGEIHALLGENGAGKSTLVKMVYGLLTPDEGEILWRGRTLQAHTPRLARRLGIGMVFQHFSLFEAMTVAENVALGLDAPPPLGVLAGNIADISEQYGLPLDPARPVHTLSVGERQRIEIVRCLLAAPKLLIMDEPTSVLAPQEIAALFETLRRLAAEGCSILYISHKLEEIRGLCHRATVLREGRVAAACDPREQSASGLAALMMGADLPREAVARRVARSRAAPRLTLDALDLPARQHGETALHGVALDVHAGEIVGIAGIAGNGQNELFAALTGERLAQNAADVRIDERSAGHFGPARRRNLGLCAVPEERNGHGAVPGFSLADNAVLTGHARAGLSRRGLIDSAATGKFVARIIDGFGVRCAGAQARAATLSGGNLQKFILGREIFQKPGVLVVAQPSWGVDRGAAMRIHAALAALAAEGAAILAISQDLDELLLLSHRLGVLCGGRLSPLRDAASYTAAEIGMMMGGATQQKAEDARLYA